MPKTMKDKREDALSRLESSTWENSKAHRQDKLQTSWEKSRKLAITHLKTLVKRG